MAHSSIRGLAQNMRSEIPASEKWPANEAVQSNSSPRVVALDSACHAGGRGFESRRSRSSRTKNLQIAMLCCLVRRYRPPASLLSRAHPARESPHRAGACRQFPQPGLPVFWPVIFRQGARRHRMGAALRPDTRTAAPVPGGRPFFVSLSAGPSIRTTRPSPRGAGAARARRRSARRTRTIRVGRRLPVRRRGS